MAVKIRLQRKGRKQAPFYHIVIADARSPRDGKYITRIGSYNPMTKPATIDIDRDAAFDWLSKGAQPTDTVRAILRFKGVYVKRHLMRGVAKGAFTLEEANQKWEQWITNKESHIQERTDKTKAERAAFLKAVHGEAKPKAAPVPEEGVTAQDGATAEEGVSVEEGVTASEEIVATADESQQTDTPAPEQAVPATEDPKTVAEESATQAEETTEQVMEQGPDTTPNEPVKDPEIQEPPVEEPTREDNPVIDEPPAEKPTTEEPPIIEPQQTPDMPGQPAEQPATDGGVADSNPAGADTQA